MAIYDDATEAYANGRDYFIEFQSVHTPSMMVKFKAIITSFSQDFSANFNKQNVFGRMDPITTFQNTQRTINLGWKTISFSAEEGAENLKKINLLSRMLYPTYDDLGADIRKVGDNSFTGAQLGSNALTMAKPPLIRVKFVNWMQSDSGNGLICAIDGFSYEPDFQEEGVFDYAGNIVPKTININCSITVLHESDLGWTQTGEWLGSDSFPFVTSQTPHSTKPVVPLAERQQAAEEAPTEVQKNKGRVLGDVKK